MKTIIYKDADFAKVSGNIMTGNFKKNLSMINALLMVNLLKKLLMN